MAEAAKAGKACDSDVPALRENGPGHLAACHLSAAKKQSIWAELSAPAAPGKAGSVSEVDA